MRRISCALLLGIALIAVAACAQTPGNTGAAPKAGQTSATGWTPGGNRRSCDSLEGYPGCYPRGTGASGYATANPQAPAP